MNSQRNNLDIHYLDLIEISRIKSRCSISLSRNIQTNIEILTIYPEK